MISTTFLISLALATGANAVTRIVNVGQNGLQFTPNITTASVGDVVEFHYFPKNHSVVQSLFANPCMSTQGFYSGFIPSAAGEASKTFSITVNSTDPIWFYCSQPGAGGHCKQGMVGCVNCPATTGKSLAAYALAANKTSNTTVTQPAVVAGGVFGTPGNAAASSASVVSSTSTTLVTSAGASAVSTSAAVTTSITTTTATSSTASAASATRSGAAITQLPAAGVVLGAVGGLMAAIVL